MNDTDVDASAAREVQEELGIDKPDPKYLFKFSYEDDCTRAWSYVYFQQWGGKVKPQESEIDALFYWSEDKIQTMIKSGAKITPDGIVAF